jgi:hypothetical protein
MREEVEEELILEQVVLDLQVAVQEVLAVVALEVPTLQIMEILELQILVEGEEELLQHLEFHKLEVVVVLVLSSSVIRSVNSQSKQLVEQFLILVVKLFILLLHQQTLILPTHH